MKKQIAFGIRVLIFIFIAASLPDISQAQECSEAALFQKYWQYKKRFNRSFIVQDRDSSGCVNDGIGFTAPNDTSSSCKFEKEGYGLPATNLRISPVGWGVPGGELNDRFNWPDTSAVIYDRDCGGDISGWGNNDNKHNWIDFGSETLTQLGWHFVTLATEYELLGRSGQTAEQQRVLEEIFLGIQAIRRLDMQTQCMIKQMYDNRKANEKLVCESPFTSRCHRNWDSNVNDDCNFTPDFSGYNGFFIRCDAAQNLERFLHDSTEQSWNVDAVGGAFGGLNASATCKDIDPLCYMAATQHFMSQDQLINLFYGFTFIKKYIPQNATITTCNGETYRPLEMVQQLSESIVDKINVNGDHITLPGSADCCRKIVKLSECEGGNVRHTLYGLLKATEYITGKDKWVTWAQQLDFEVFPANAPNSGLSFYLKESCMFKDLSNIARDKRRKMAAIAKDKNKEILLLGNDLLFPSGESISDRVGGKDFFKGLLCDAPCSGPCHAGRGYNTWPGPNPGDGWPSDFQCANIPGWEGHRWDAEGVGVDEGVNGPPSRGNGLDYMALFNMYMLKYGTGDFYNPQRTQPSNLLTPYSGINGLDVLCPQVAGTYAIEGVTPNAGIQNILWSSSPNLTLSSTTGLTTTAIFNNSGPSGSLSVNYSLTRQLRQHYIQPSMTVSTPGDTTYTSILSPDSTFVPEQCELTGNKQIQLASSQLWIRHQAEPCEWLFAVWAQPSETGNFNWTISHNGDVIQANGQMVYFMELFEAVYGYGYRNNYGGSYHFLLSYDNGCGGVQTVTATIEIEECEDDIHKYMRITPNPAHTDVNVSVFVKSTNGLIPTDVLDNFNKPGGYPVWIKRTDGGPNLISTRLYINGGQLDVSSLPTGYYNLQIQLDDTPQPLSQIFIIAK